MRTSSLVMVSLILVNLAEARFTSRDRQNAINHATTQANGISSNAQSGSSTQTTNYSSLEQSSQNTMNNSQKGQTIATIMQVGMYGAGAYFASQCPGNTGACVQAGIMFLMGSQAGRSAASFDGPINGAWSNVCTYSSLGCSGTPPNPYTAQLTPGTIKQGQSQQDQAKIKDALGKGGYSVDVNSGIIKTPKGDLNANDPSSLKSALGEGYDAMMNKVAEVEKNAKAKVDSIKQGSVTAALGLESFGTGGAAIPAGEANAESINAQEGLASKLDQLRYPSGQAKGLTRNFNGDPIGVAADSIFDMMSRRYQLKSTQKTFFNAADAVQ